MAPSDPRPFSLSAKSPAIPGLFFFAACLVLAVIALRLLDPGAPRARVPFLTPPQIQHFTFGTREQAADSLWIRAIQDFDYCEKEVAKQTCVSTGWLYRMLDLVTELSPKLRAAYTMGATSLTIIVNDFAGASKLFDKGVREFPNDWVLLGRAAYHALYEEKNNEKAAALLQRAARNGAPPWYYLLATRLYGKEGRAELAENLLRQFESDPNPDPVLVRSLKERIGKLKADHPAN